MVKFFSQESIIEEMEESVILDLMSDDNTWWKQWFRSIKLWQKNVVDTERVTWIRVHGVPCNAWNIDFFVRIANTMGKFIIMDENFTADGNMDLARILVRVPLSFFLKERVLVVIDDDVFELSFREDALGPFRVVNKKHNQKAISYIFQALRNLGPFRREVKWGRTMGIISGIRTESRPTRRPIS